MPFGFQLSSEFKVIEDLSVVRDPVASMIRHWLVTIRRQIEYREPPVS
jgi:hypothetical protein